MATSSNLLDDKIRNFLSKFSFDNFLDIGSGEGKFGKMTRELYPKSRIVGVEPDPNTIQEFKLNEIYDKVIKKTATELTEGDDFVTDICIMGDVIEHLKKSEAIDFLNFILYRCKYLIIKFPFCYLQYGDKFVRHQSIWFFEDFDALHLPIILKEYDKYMSLVIMKGLPLVKDDFYKKHKLIREEIPNAKSI